MIQKITENLPVLVALVVVILALYSLAFRRIWRERRGRSETAGEKLLAAEDSDAESHRG